MVNQHFQTRQIKSNLKVQTSQKLLLEMLSTFAQKYNANSGLHHLVKKYQWDFKTITLRPSVTFFFVVLFITCFRLDTHCTYDCIGTSEKNCLNPHEGVLVKTTTESFWLDIICVKYNNSTLDFDLDFFNFGCKQTYLRETTLVCCPT